MAAGQDAEYQAHWGLDMIHAAQAYALGYTGKGVVAAVVDDGNTLSHSEFRKGSVGGIIVGNPSQPQVTGSHGTAVAGMLGAARDGVGMHGVAYDATLLPLLAAFEDDWQRKDGSPLRVAADAGAGVLNASYGPDPLDSITEEGTGQYKFYYEDARSRQDPVAEENALRHAAAKDVVAVYAAGNEYLDYPKQAVNPSGYGLLPFVRPENHFAGVYQVLEQARPDLSQAGQDGASDTRPMPAGDPRLAEMDYSDLEGAMIVAVALNADREIASYSNRCGVAWRWCVAAPGGDDPRPGVAPDRAYVMVPSAAGGYRLSAGTSFAAPLVAGSAAILRQAFPYFTARQTIEVLLTSADRSGHLAERAIYGRGLLDIGRAVRGPVEFGAEGFAPVFDVDTKGHDSRWSNDIGGFGGLAKRGAGTLVLAGNNYYQGPTTIAGGTVDVTGAIATSRVTVQPGGTLSGTGVTGPTEVRGVIAPGRPGQALTVAGDFVHRAEGTYVAQLDANATTSDRVDVQGRAVLQQGQFKLQGPPLRADAVGRDYVVLQAAGGIDGTFSTTQEPYLFVDLRHGVQAGAPTRYAAGWHRNETPFATVAQTRNQAAVAGALDRAAPGLGPRDVTLVGQDAATVARRFDLWSGEVHASMLSASIEQAGTVREAALARSRQMTEVLVADDKAGVTGRPAIGLAGGKGLWGQYSTGRHQLRGDGNAAGVRASGSGVVFGNDFAIGTHSRAGLLAGFGHDRVNADDGRGRVSADDFTLGAYGVTQLQDWRLSYGTAYTGYHARSRRDMGEFGRAESRYKGSAAQAYAEAAWMQQWGRMQFEPYAGLAYVHARRGAFSESADDGPASGGAALDGKAASQQLMFSTLGLRGSTGWQLDKGRSLSLRAGLGWRHAHGKVAPGATMHFAQGETFDVHGAPVARDALLLQAGLQLKTAGSMEFGVNYAGQMARGAPSHAVQANALWRF